MVLSPIEQAGLALMVFVLMLGMGATLTWHDFRLALQHPKAILIGFASQFAFMPAIAYGLTQLFNLPLEVSLTLVMVGTTPGGTTSNLFTYFAKGDVASITMTVASTIAAVVMMPILLSMWASQFTSAELQIAYKNIVATLIMILVPVSIGMWVRKISTGKAQLLEKIGGIIGIIVIIFLIAEYSYKKWDVLMSTAASIFAAGILLGICGFIIGLTFSRLIGLDLRKAKAVSLETGIQNTPLTIAIIALSFPQEQQGDLLLLPTIYAMFIVITSSVTALIYRQLEAKPA